ncbi:MAG: hypothetical protein JSV02_01255 [Dehalococcoidia bacterium]|nr:MAG: hypothetical protein JSV02_01255 [Dehalococcoidia bacterium]
MTRLLVGGLVGASLVMLIVGFAIPALALGPGSGETGPTSQDAWEAMYEPCIVGDWEAMAKAMEAIHDRYFTSMPCFSYGFDEGTQAPDTGWGGSGGHKGGGMMGGRGAMMGW